MYATYPIKNGCCSQVESAIQRAWSGGQPLDGTVQAEMGVTLGHDFSAVRMHADAEADALNQQLGAKAFTTGRDIFFRGNAYEPGSSFCVCHD